MVFSEPRRSANPRGACGVSGVCSRAAAAATSLPLALAVPTTAPAASALHHHAAPEEVGRLEAALSWPGRYLHQRPLVMRVVQSVARYRAIGYESDKIAHRLHKPAVTVRRINRAGLDAIAAGLRRDGAAVF